jgi:hypothetical protein
MGFTSKGERIRLGDNAVLENTSFEFDKCIPRVLPRSARRLGCLGRDQIALEFSFGWGL